MTAPNPFTARLVLQDGTVLEGFACGRRGSVIGEVVFNTGMTGYQEVLTDPSYSGQLITFTYPEIGNTGVNPDDQEADQPHARGLIVRQMAPQASNWRSKQSLPEWLEQNGVIGIHGVDTRALVRHLRELGPMNGVISSDGRPPLELLEDLKQAPSMEGLNLADQVTTPTACRWTKSCSVAFDQRFQTRPERPYRVVAIDFGIKRAILERLVSHGCDLTVLPANTDLDTVLSRAGRCFLSNGPGDPAAVQSGITLAPMFAGTSSAADVWDLFGHQILGLALGGKTFKLAYGHRGLNHPCGSTGQVEITSQNHGFALDAGSLPEDKIEVTHFNLNDRTVAAFAHRNQPVFGVQYHPEASPGPHDADHHFARFTGLMADRR